MMKSQCIYYIYSVTVTHESVSLPIAGILNWSSFGLNNTYSNSLYVERDIVENMIKKHKKTEDRKLYVICVNYDKYYENELPKDFDVEVNMDDMLAFDRKLDEMEERERKG